MAKKIMGSAKASRRKSRKKASAIQARRKKEFMFRGYNMEQLRAMPFDEVLELGPAIWAMVAHMVPPSLGSFTVPYLRAVDAHPKLPLTITAQPSSRRC